MFCQPRSAILLDMKDACVVQRLGCVPYERAWALQDKLAAEIGAGEHPPALLLLEHPHTFTFGRRGRIENLIWDEAELSRRGVKVHWVDRGGDVTYHGPGQLVGYPLLPLARASALVAGVDGQKPHLPHMDYVGYLRKLEQIIILALSKFGVAAAQIPGLTGVWVRAEGRKRAVDQTSDSGNPPAKIAAIGVKVDARGISRHGFALNVDPDMTFWDGIVGCGLEGFPAMSLAALRQPAPEMQEVEDAIIRAFSQVFGYRMVAAGLRPADSQATTIVHS